MKKVVVIFIFGFLSICMAAPSHAETRYISDMMEITLRTGPGLNYRIIKMLNSGQTVETLESEENWTRVRLSDDTTGWVFSRYITRSKPKSLLADSLQKEIGPLRTKVKSLTEENQRLIQRNQEMAEELEETREQLENLQNEYATLQEDSGDYLKLKDEHASLTKTLEEKNQRIQTLEKQVSDAFFSAGLKWFLAGAGVLVLGMIIGNRIASRKKRPGLR
ncbi:MAG: TIGR04211 family SH3 domain-containing protein [Desulfobacterales bacterium]|nr:TIGR04211 family SH3 domain-containing protein [Desulfobacterales bacterium]